MGSYSPSVLLLISSVLSKEGKHVWGFLEGLVPLVFEHFSGWRVCTNCSYRSDEDRLITGVGCFPCTCHADVFLIKVQATTVLFMIVLHLKEKKALKCKDAAHLHRSSERLVFPSDICYKKNTESNLNTVCNLNFPIAQINIIPLMTCIFILMIAREILQSTTYKIKSVGAGNYWEQLSPAEELPLEIRTVWPLVFFSPLIIAVCIAFKQITLWAVSKWPKSSRPGITVIKSLSIKCLSCFVLFFFFMLYCYSY